jgi:1-aminocyclopropane-1-carboxylate deaminase/D-cysteine desulfhydrase-like pyridoxal-dependent ACC family enzyme
LSELWPLFDRFAELAALPHLSLRSGPTPVESLESLAPNLWIKRDDLTALPIGGNKVRSLEFLLGGVNPGDRVATVGSRGSTHALATAIHGRAVGASVSVGLWPQEMNPMAEVVRDELRRVVTSRREFASPALALPWLWWRAIRGDRTIPSGGTSPLGILGHVNAALEAAAQVRSGLLPEPRQVVVPLGTGGTAAGLALGFAIAGMHPLIVAARVVPKIVGRKNRIVRLANATRAFIERQTKVRLPPAPSSSIRVVNTVYGGAYGRVLARGETSALRLSDAIGVAVDATYAGKAFVAALDAANAEPTLFWLTFDARWIGKRGGGGHAGH